MSSCPQFLGLSQICSATESVFTAIGSFLAFGFVYLIIFTGPECSTCEYKPYIVGLSLWFTVFTFSYLAMKKPQWELSIDVALISFLVILATEYLNPHPEEITLTYVIDRTSMITAGVVIAFLCSYVILPVRGSQLIKKGLRNTLATDFGTVLSGVMKLYSSPAPASREEFSERKRKVYSTTSAVLTKVGKMKNLLDTTSGEVTKLGVWGGRCRIETFPAKKYTTIMFCSNQLMYITVTLFYGLQGEATNTGYCKLFGVQLDAIRLRFEKMFVDISVLLEKPEMFLDVAAHIQVVQTLLEQVQSQHKENLLRDVTFSYSFDEIQTFSHLWSCLRLYLKKVSHLVDAILGIHDHRATAPESQSRPQPQEQQQRDDFPSHDDDEHHEHHEEDEMVRNKTQPKRRSSASSQSFEQALRRKLRWLFPRSGESYGRETLSLLHQRSTDNEMRGEEQGEDCHPNGQSAQEQQV